MNDHDPLCPWAREPQANRDRADCPFCPQIEAVRADERERIAQAIEAERAVNWEAHLANHPHSDIGSCPVDYAIRDTFDYCTEIARGQV